VRFEVDAGGQTLTATAAHTEGVEIIAYLGGRDPRLACGARTPPDNVLLTWRAEDAADAGAPRKIAVALEFMPEGYVP
jgi:hypothetical protein